MTNGEPVGVLIDVLVDWNRGQPEFGLLKLANNIHPDAGVTAVPWSLLRFGTDSNRVQILVTKEALRRAPQAHANDGIRFEDRQWLAQARQHFGAQGSDSGMSGTLRGSGSSAPREGLAAGGDYLGAGSRGASIAVYIVGALIVGIITGRYWFYRRSQSASAAE